MLNNLISAFIVFRLECRQLAVDLEWVLARWRQCPAIEIVLDRRQEGASRRMALRRKLDEVYPF